MEHFLINSSACLFVLWLFYKIALENTSWHHWKRYYLLVAIVISIVIPFIVVETIVIPVENSPMVAFASSPIVTDIMNQQKFQLDWTNIFWVVYVMGLLVMLWRFIKNLTAFRLQDEDEVSSYSNYQLVLRKVFTVPHSFLQRIFVARKEFENDQIPSAVLEHEKAHLDQKHSLDILFIELLLIIFWFNPLLYIIRYSIKLNHEFLADKAVIEQGMDTIAYQETLLNYTQQSHSTALANTFNFPIIKKRFRIMKTQTSHTSLLLRSLALIPVLALLIISCGKEETEFQEIEEIIEVVEEPTNQKQIIVDGSTEKGYITIKDSTYAYTVKGDQVQIFNRFGKLQDFESQGYVVFAVTEEETEIVEEFESATSAIEYINAHKDELNYYLREDQIAASTAIHIIEKYGQNGVEISPDDKGIMSIKIIETEENKETLPPPPPPAPLMAKGYMQVDGRVYSYTTKEDDHNFYDHDGNIIDIKGKKVIQVEQSDLPPPPPPATIKN
ncbi:MAG: M56 family metallopeptidase [Nonlabens sp.]|uniref:M56 family metallopeptidase n=1 Tax=Nonlabens sp. TaxID=1888209 RepID=UPI003EF096FA